MNIEHNKHLLAYNTFGIDTIAEEFVQINLESELMELLQYANNNQTALHIIGGGSNILFVHDIKGLVLLNQLKGMQIVYEDKDIVHVKCMSGEVWHECVLWSVAKNYGGIENLSLIPGTIGAAPIQNIGAYGVELKDVFVELEAIHLRTLEKKIFTHQECAFAYRDSIFKRQPQRYIISAVTFSLPKNWVPQLQYADLTNFFSAPKNLPSPTAIFDAVCTIRQKKLPDPKTIGNVGSFFKNPSVSQIQLAQLLNAFPRIITYPQGNGSHKLAAGWLIDQCGFKGAQRGAVGVYEKQALVLVNLRKGTATELLALASEIQAAVQDRFGILLEIEPVRM